MIPLKKDFKHGVVSLKVTLLDDLWYLLHIIAPGDVMTTKTERKIKLNSGSDTNTKVVRKTFILSLIVESVSLSDSTDQLRVKGIVKSGPDDVPIGSYHTFGIEINDSFTLVKSSWPKFIVNRLEDSIKNTAEAVLFVLFDRDSALFSLVRQTGIEHLAELKVSSQKKQYESSNSESIYDLIVDKLKTYFSQFSISGIVAASPNFYKEYLDKKLTDDLKKKTIFISSNDVSRSSVIKLLARPELNTLLLNQRLQKEQNFSDLVLEKLNKEEVAYGFKDVLNAANIGAALSVGVTDKFISKLKEENKFDSLDSLLKTIDSSQGKIFFIQSKDVSKTIDGLGGIVAVLRWKL